jgi:hypothetical protein
MNASSTGADANQFRIANLERKNDDPCRSTQHFSDAHRSASPAMPEEPGSSCDSRRTPSNHTRTCNKLRDVYM